MSGDTRTINYYTYGSAAPTIKTMVDEETRRESVAYDRAALAKERIKKAQQLKAATAVVAKTVPGISVFAILGTLFVAVLMVFVVLAQINFNETAIEAVRLSNQLVELSERHKALELTFERAIDIKEVERFARDELGMSRPDAGQVLLINTTPRDIAFYIEHTEDRGIQGFGTFLRSLTDYFR